MVRAKCSAPPSGMSSRATAVITTCLSFMRRTASATRSGSSCSRGKGLAVSTAQNPQARVQRSPAIIMVAVPPLQHSQRFGHWALSQTVWRRRSEIIALVEKKTGFDGRRTLIQSGLRSWWSAGSILGVAMGEEIKGVGTVKKSKRTKDEFLREGTREQGLRGDFRHLGGNSLPLNQPSRCVKVRPVK